MTRSYPRRNRPLLGGSDADKMPNECGVETLISEIFASLRAECKAFIAGSICAMRILSEVARISFPTAM